ncbi:hypothetical protein SAMN04487819_110114 [Actinopolyspora alba]|uniref:Thioredoxin family protein n=1 Tax=Actinopolyspora alba TaxID=673379 RepID=A0A1I1Z7V8_9ACTN|nr:thioredoxin family protein [Actinopolyspora alba]SFE27787.1 hypothetical protein SAMN04487819_110114 [Actinopolyspora alba]
MEIELLYSADCPNWHIARAHLAEALEAVGNRTHELVLRAVGTDEEARALRFPGSPTIRLNGHDLFPDTSRNYGLACRVYSTPDGLSGAPTVDQLVQALTNGT